MGSIPTRPIYREKNSHAEGHEEKGDKPREVINGEVKTFIERLRHSSAGQAVTLPDGRNAVVKEVIGASARSKKFDVTYFHLETEHGPKMFVRQIGKKSGAQDLFDASAPLTLRNPAVHRFGFRIKASDPAKVRDFYEVALSLPLTKSTRTSATFAGILQLVWDDPNDEERAAKLRNEDHRVTIWIEVGSVREALHRLRAYGIRMESEIQSSAHRRWFRCSDPEGNPVEVFEVIGRAE